MHRVGRREERRHRGREELGEGKDRGREGERKREEKIDRERGSEKERRRGNEKENRRRE